MTLARRQPFRTGHRIGFGRIHSRMPRVTSGLSFLAALQSDNRNRGVNEPDGFTETHMSDEHQSYEQHHDQQHHDQYQPEHTHHETYEPEQAAVSEPVPSAESLRLDAIEAAIGELKAGIAELKALHEARPVHHEPVPEPVHLVEAAVAAEPVPDLTAERLGGIEATLAEVRSTVGGMSASFGDIAGVLASLKADIDQHKSLHAETQAMVDEQHNLMRRAQLYHHCRHRHADSQRQVREVGNRRAAPLPSGV